MKPKTAEMFLKIHHHFHSTTVNSSLWVKWGKKGKGGDIKVDFNEVLSQQLLEANETTRNSLVPEAVLGNSMWSPTRETRLGSFVERHQWISC